jgi:hypothetical protein
MAEVVILSGALAVSVAIVLIAVLGPDVAGLSMCSASEQRGHPRA